VIGQNILMPLLSVPASAFAGLCWKIARRAQADRKRRLRRLEIELRLGDALETFHQEVFRLKHSRVLRSKALKAELFPSTKASSLRYIQGRQK
jgi:hypothetical protein